MIKQALVMVGAAAAFAAFGNIEPNVVAKVNDNVLSVADLDKQVDAMMSRLGNLPAEHIAAVKKNIRPQLVQTFIQESALVDAAKAAGLSVSEKELAEKSAEFLKQVAHGDDAPKTIEEFFEKSPLGREEGLARFKKSVLIDKLITAEMKKAEGSGSPEDAAAEAAALTKIKAIKAELDACAEKDIPAKFAELAKKNSECPSSRKGGDLGFFGHGQMVPEFDKASFSLPVGKVSEPVKTAFGYHLILVTDKSDKQVKASHILVKSTKPGQASGPDAKRREIFNRFIRAAKIETSEEFRSLLPSGSGK